MKKYFLLLLVFTGCFRFESLPPIEPPTPITLSTSQTIPGYDVLGVAKYCGRFLQAPILPGMSTLLNTFGDPLPCVEKRIQQGGLKVVQVDLIDATCWRNHNCPPGVSKPTDLKVIRKRSSLVYALAIKYPEIEWWVSPALEDDVRDVNKKRQMLEAAKAGCPTCKIINSPFTGAKPDGYPIEKHGTKVSSFSVSSDGASVFDGDNLRSDDNGFEHRISGSYTTYVWFNELNLRCTGEEHAPPPKLRTAKPTYDLFYQAYLTTFPEASKPPNPPQCREVRDIQKGKEITKPNAEQYCNGQQKDKRGNKPLLIIKKAGRKGDKLNVLRSDGQKVAQFCYYGTYKDLPGTHRWYMGDCSGQTPAELYNILNSEWGFLYLGSGKCLRFNSIRRQGTYR